MQLGRHYQNAYVTRDIATAVDRFARWAGLEPVATFDVAQQVRTPQGAGVAELRVALAWVGALQYEFIQPLGGRVALYEEALPPSGVRLHHTAAQVEDWDALQREIARQGLAIAQEGESGPLRFLYADGRQTLGHYLEYVVTTPEGWARIGAPWATSPGPARGDAHG